MRLTTAIACGNALGILVLLALMSAPAASAGEWSWEKPHAQVLPTGDLQWQPEPFSFETGASVRYIDFESGDDSAPGTREAPWKHHPWDPKAEGVAAGATGIDTCVFKRGIVYRGELRTSGSGQPGSPIRLTSDPDWGRGDAVLSGAEQVRTWQRLTSHPQIPEPGKVWFADLDFTPRNVWMVEDDGSVVRIPLARTPNWHVSNPDDIKSEWWTWNYPGKPFDVFTTGPNGNQLHLGIDTAHLTQPADYYEGAIVWTEYGWVMGTPYPARVEAVDTEQKGLGFGGQWGGVGGQKIVRHNRYYLEDKPHYLDEAGEFWFDRQGSGGRLYLRLPGDRDPNSAHIEAGKRVHVIDSTGVSHLHITGLTFRFTNVLWDLTTGPWSGEDVEPACIRLLGPGRDLRVSHCRFEHVHRAVRLKALNDGDAIDDVVLADNTVTDADHAAFEVADDGDWGVAEPRARVFDVSIMRNRIERTGLRPSRYGQGHAVTVRHAQTLEVAGNILDQLYGSGIFVFGGKQSDAIVDRPLSRILIHHNKVTNSLLNTNDWGGIETWQGGPAYVYSNISGNPGGYWHYNFMLNPGTPARARFGHAYYMDGAYKNYYFNNIAWGGSKDPLSPLGNTAAFQEIHGFQNTLFNNTAYNFVTGSRRQAPIAGRNKYMGSIWQDIGFMVFRHADPAQGPAEGNAADAGKQRDVYALNTNAYERGVFFDVADFGVFEPTGRVWQSFDEFRDALGQYGPLAGDLGVVASKPPLRDAAGHDFRLSEGSEAVDAGVRVFVPWALYGTVAEWHFMKPGDGRNEVLDEHWYLTPYHVTRDDYWTRPTYPLQTVGVSASDYVEGPLEDWTRGALSLDGQSQYAVLKHDVLSKPFEHDVSYNAPPWVEVTAPDRVSVDAPLVIDVRLLEIDTTQKLHADLHWSNADGQYMGTNAWGGPGRQVTGEGPYTFQFEVQKKADLGGLTVVLFLTPTGEWKDQTKVARLSLPLAQPDGPSPQRKATPIGGGPAKETRHAQGADLKNPQIHNSNALVEAYFRTSPGSTGVIIEKMQGSGYSLSVCEAGTAMFSVAGGDLRASVAGRVTVNDGKWHHVIAEMDRGSKTLSLYVDGRTDATASGFGSDVSLANAGDVHVGGTPSGRCLAGSLEFLRIALGTLADAKTNIEELYAWQFDGPFLRDFRGQPASGARRDAGALELGEE